LDLALLFLFDKHYPIMEQLGLKDSYRDLQLNCAISYYFYLYLIFHTCATRFDVTGNLIKFWVFRCITKPKATTSSDRQCRIAMTCTNHYEFVLEYCR
jgi:hypothetical protein